MLGGFQTMKRVYIELQRNFAAPPPDDCEYISGQILLNFVMSLNGW